MFYAAISASRILKEEMFKLTLFKPKNGNAQHLQVVSIVSLRTGFQLAIETLENYMENELVFNCFHILRYHLDFYMY